MTYQNHNSISYLANKIYSDYDEALNACNGIGYSYQKLTDAVVKKNLIARQSVTQESFLSGDVSRTILGLGFAFNLSSVRVLDFGGGGGYHYTLAKHVLGDKCEIKWNIVETDSMCKSGAIIADQSLKFFSDINTAFTDLGEIDLILTSSALQYCSDPLLYLRNLLDISARYIYITRTPLHSGDKKIISIQSSMLSENGPGSLPSDYEDQEILYPISYIPIFEIERIIKEKYQIKFKIKEESANLFIENIPVNEYFGYFCELK